MLVQAGAANSALPIPVTLSMVQAAAAARVAELARCPDAPPWLTLGIDVGPRVALVEIQHSDVDPAEPLDRCVRAIVESLALPVSDRSVRHVVTLELSQR